MPEYPYTGHEPACSSRYLWPALRQILLGRAPPPRRVFDLGCGNGATARMLAEAGYSVVGVDPSRSGIEIARRAPPSGCEFEVASASGELGNRFGTFPVVVSLEVLEHCHSPREYMAAFRSVLGRDGIGVLSTPYHAYLKNLLVVASGRFDHHFDPLWEGGHVRFFSRKKLVTLLVQSGLRLLEFRRVGRIPPLAKSMIAVVAWA